MIVGVNVRVGRGVSVGVSVMVGVGEMVDVKIGKGASGVVPGSAVICGVGVVRMPARTWDGRLGRK